ncbi:bifunctional deaminase-reductase-like protein [Candidatus Koribacter versatilis Ellin345]|uniref:Bifunctional deaminase-reductase-like protein n=1 Tax=Koribacter versatilis (strain Ellin345) TaxID=204669 RepID=Q1IP57_KORVE|nr:dihydrofolate reductase family protein [Candidatus Koribacter versatilis]ABF41343.1 bifunctional deaminase-reductase-like protein [Candidatus Koribacter versatilis Ellin345]
MVKMAEPFEILFDRAELSPVEHPAYARYGHLGFPSAPFDRPWIYSNFVQSLDGIVSLLGRHFAGGDISQSPDDRWLMDLLRAHADAILTGATTLLDERNARGADSRGIVFRVVDPEVQDLRTKLGLGPERNLIATGHGKLPWRDLKLFDGSQVEPGIVTTELGATNLGSLPSHVALIIAGEGPLIDWSLAAHKLRDDLNIRNLLCEGGPTLYGALARADLIDEKFVTISPIETGQLVPPEQERQPNETGPALLRPTIFGGPGFTKETATWWRWISSRKLGDHEFNRYRRRRVQNS